MKERWLITGAGGFIGRRLVQILSDSGASVIGWRRSDADLIHVDSVRRAMSGVAPTHLVHLAASISTPSVTDWRYIASEVAMVSNLVEAMPSHCRFLCAGSMAEFGRAGRFDETAICRPNSAYGLAKSAATDRAMTLRRITRQPIAVARLFGVYGPGESQNRLLPQLARALMVGRRIPLSTGNQVRDFIHVDDVCEIIVALLRTPEMPALINVGTGIGLSVRQVCEAIVDVLGASPDLLGFGERPYREVDETELVADTRLLSRHANVPPQRWLDPYGLVETIRSAAYV